MDLCLFMAWCALFASILNSIAIIIVARTLGSIGTLIARKKSEGNSD